MSNLSRPVNPGKTPKSPVTDSARLSHALRSLRTNWLTALGGHSGIGILFAAMGRPLTGLIAFLISISCERLLTLRSSAMLLSLSRDAGLSGSVARELLGLISLRSVIAAAILFTLMTAQGFGGVFYPMVLCGIMTATFIVQLASVPRIATVSTLPMLAVSLYVAFRVQNYLPPVAVWTTIATGVMACAWMAHYTWRAQLKTLQLIDEGRRNQEALRAALDKTEAEARVREQLEREVGMGFYEVDLKTATTKWSPGAFRVYGRPESDIVPEISDIAAQVADGSGPALARDYLRMIYKGTTVVQRYPINAPDGTRRYVRTIAVPQRDLNGEIVALSGVLVDETAQMEVVEASSVIERRLKAALSVGASVLWEFNFITEESYALGLPEHFVGPDFQRAGIMNEVMERICPSYMPMVLEAFETSAKTNHPQIIEHEMRLEGGELGWVRTTIIGQHRTDGPGYAMVTALTSDISDEMQRRQVLASALDDAQAASRAKSSFLANMSHEIRTPLHGILSVANLLANSDLDDRQREMMALIQTSGTALSTVVNDVLDLARVESGRLEINPQPIDLSAAVRSAAGLFQLKAAEKSLELAVISDVDDDIRVNADPVRLSQIVTNLVSNAVKFTTQGQVTVHLKGGFDGLSVGDVAPIQIVISDTGAGIPTEMIAKLFNRFEQIDGSITREHGGSGLGLAIAQSLAELMGGGITVESLVGSGTAFTVRLNLPVAAKAAVLGEVAGPSSSCDDDAPLRILAADDHPTNREVLKFILTPLGVDLTLCENGQEALEAFKTAPFDVVLMDLQMPVMDGLTAISQIRAFEKASGRLRTPIAAVTANAMTHHQQEAKQAGADRHIAKPFSPEQLLTGISDLLEQGDDAAIQNVA